MVSKSCWRRAEGKPCSHLHSLHLATEQAEQGVSNSANGEELQSTWPHHITALLAAGKEVAQLHPRAAALSPKGLMSAKEETRH